jgi:hypothetical protein
LLTQTWLRLEEGKETPVRRLPLSVPDYKPVGDARQSQVLGVEIQADKFFLGEIKRLFTISKKFKIALYRWVCFIKVTFPYSFHSK